MNATVGASGLLNKVANHRDLTMCEALGKIDHCCRQAQLK
jgi:hypothetical protein